MQIIHTLLIDLEEALLNPFGDIPPATMSILLDLHSKGIRLGLISRHAADWTKRFLARKHIDSLFSFILAAYGAQYANLQTGTVRNLSCFSRTLATQTIALASAAQKNAQVALDYFPITYVIDTGRRFVYGRPGFFSLLFQLRNHSQKPGFHGLESLDDDTLIPRIFLVGSKPLLTSMEKSTDLLSYPKTRVSPRALEISAPQTSLLKAYACAREDFGLEDKTVMTFACSARSVPLLEATTGIAMKNAVPEALEAAWRTTKYNAAQNGIAYMINVLLMEKACSFRPVQNEDTTDEKPENKTAASGRKSA